MGRVTIILNKCFFFLAIYDELLKCSNLEAVPVIRYSLSLIVTAALENNIEINTLIACVKNAVMSESNNLHTLHHILFFIKKYNTVRIYYLEKFIFRIYLFIYYDLLLDPRNFMISKIHKKKVLKMTHTIKNDFKKYLV